MRPQIAIATGCAAVLVAWSGWPGVAAESQRLVEQRVMLTALDDDDVPVRGLTVKDFLLKEGEATYEVSEVSLATDPIDIALLVDATKSTQISEDPTRDLRTALAGFVEVIRASGIEARIAVYEVAGSAVQTVSFEDTPAALDERLGKLFPSALGGAVFLEAIAEAGREMSRVDATRRAIVSIDFDSLEHSDIPPNTVADAVQHSGAAYWAVSIRRRGEASPEREVIMNQLPRLTGGARITATAASGLESMLRKVAQGLTTQYVVTYYAPANSSPRQFQVGARGASKILLGLMAQSR